MKFKSFIPAGARAHIALVLEGDGRAWQGVNAFIREYRGKASAIDVLRGLEREKACYLRFANDDRMRDVYAALGKADATDEIHAGFLRAAWIADMDYRRVRKRSNDAATLAPKIAEAARELARLLTELGETGSLPPVELYSVRDLLDATDSIADRNLDMWRGLRHTITGSKGSLSYAWEVAPDIPALLGTIATIADAWIPTEEGATGSAIASRKKNPATAYLRAFAHLLRDNLRLTFDAPIVAAIAGVANVVLNEPDIDISADAARLAIARCHDDSLEK